MGKIREILSETLSDLKDFSDDSEMIRAAIIGELDAINLYSQLATKIKNKDASKILLDIAYEEKVHVGELEKVLSLIDPEFDKSNKEGKKEVEDGL